MTPYQRIVAAAKLGKGVRLSAAEVAQMARDSAIVELAENDEAFDRLCRREPPSAWGDE